MKKYGFDLIDWPLMRLPFLLYSLFKKFIPIPCVDVVVKDSDARVLLLMRSKDPGKDQWWFPGGRVYRGEHRTEAAVRKIHEECGIPESLIESKSEIGTYDVFFEGPPKTPVFSHAITTVFLITLSGQFNPKLDNQSRGFEWLVSTEWAKKDLNEFVRQILKKIE